MFGVDTVICSRGIDLRRPGCRTVSRANAGHPSAEASHATPASIKPFLLFTLRLRSSVVVHALPCVGCEISQVYWFSFTLALPNSKLNSADWLQEIYVPISCNPPLTTASFLLSFLSRLFASLNSLKDCWSCFHRPCLPAALCVCCGRAWVSWCDLVRLFWG